MNPRILLRFLPIWLVLFGPRAFGQESASELEAGPTQIELSIWRTPSYQRRFAESFRSQASVEPRVSAVEVDLMSDAMDLMAANDIDGAISLLESKRRVDGSAAIDFMVGNLLCVQARLEEASEALEAAVDKFPDFRRAWMRLGDLEARRGDVEAAHRALVEAYRLGANDSDTIGLLGWANAGLDRWVAAESAYRQAIMLAPDSRDWKLGLAEAMIRQRRPREALVILDELIELRPESSKFWALQAEAHLAAGDPSSAALDLEILEEIEGVTARSRSMLGDIHLEDGMPLVAADRHLAALKLAESPDPARAFVALRRLVDGGEVQAAGMLMDELRELHASGFDSRELATLERLEARVAVQRGEQAEAAAVLEKVVDEDPLDGEALILLGRYHGRMPDGMERAEYWFDRAAMIEDVRNQAKLRHADLLISRGRYAPAIALLKQVQREEERASVKALLDRVERYERQRSRDSSDDGGAS